MAQYEEIKLWYALSLAQNTFASATVKFQNSTSPTGQEVSLIYCNPLLFGKRQTDTSEALAVDPTSPDTGTGMSDVIIRVTQNRETTPSAPLLDILLDMFYLSGNDDDFPKGRFGLENTDNPELDCLPTATAGWKFINFRQEPNQDTPSLQIFEIQLKFLGDHTQLGTRSP